MTMLAEMGSQRCGDGAGNGHDGDGDGDALVLAWLMLRTRNSSIMDLLSLTA